MRPPSSSGRFMRSGERNTPELDSSGFDHTRSVRAADLTPELVAGWLEEACIDAAQDPIDERDLLTMIDDTRVNVRVDQLRGCIYLACPIGCRAELDDRALVLEALNFAHHRAMFVRGVVGGESTEHWVRWEHELHAVDGIVTKRQLVKLVRRVKQEARDAHRTLHDVYGTLVEED
ncbi:MAG: hypothetical protein JWM86_2962 [Thermoleophilia bacterium]|nr:hypothetical protein [Thermoleophilia bacterium]